MKALQNFNEEFLLLEKMREGEVIHLLARISSTKKDYDDHLMRMEKEVNVLLKKLEKKHLEELQGLSETLIKEQQQNVRMSTELDRVTKEKQEALERVVELEQQFARKGSETNTEQDSKISHLSALVKELQKEKAQLTDDLIKSKEESKNSISSLSEKCSTLSEKNTKMVEEISKHETALLEKNKSVHALEIEINNLKLMMSLAEKEKQLVLSQEGLHWKEKYEKACIEIEHKVKVEEDLNKRTDALSEALKVKDITIAELEAKVNSLQLCNTNLEGRLVIETKELLVVRSELTQTLELKAVLEEEKQRFEALSVQIKNDLDGRDNSRDALELERIRKILKEQFQKIEKLEHENHDLMIRNALLSSPNANAEIEKHKRLLLKYKSSTAKKQDIITDLETSIKEKEGQVTEMSTEINKLRDELSKQLQRVGELEAKYSTGNVGVVDPKQVEELKQQLSKMSEELQAAQESLLEMSKIRQEHDEMAHNYNILVLANTELKNNSEGEYQKVKSECDQKMKETLERNHHLEEENKKHAQFSDLVSERMKKASSDLDRVSKSIDKVLNELKLTKINVDSIKSKLESQQMICNNLSKLCETLKIEQVMSK